MTTDPTSKASVEAVADEDLLDILGDEISRAILSAAADGPVTAKELTEEGSVSAATVYRRISTLVDKGLLDERHVIDEDDGRQKVYVTTFGHVDVGVDGDGFSAVPRDCGDTCYHVLSLLDDPPFDSITANFEEQTVHVEFDLTDEALDQLSSLWLQSANNSDD
jgi:DNA-binding transcriptional ArsR family regulator